MTPTHVTPSEIARVAGITEKHVRRIIGRAVNLGLYDNPDWFGVRMHVIRDDGRLKVAFTSLPEKIREAFVMLDQRELPLPPLTDHRK